MQVRKVLCALAAAAALAAAGCGAEEEDGAVREAEMAADIQRASGPMPDTAFRAEITVARPPANMQPGQKETLLVKVKNTGDAPWPSQGRVRDGYYQVNLGDIWSDAGGEKIEGHPYVRSALPPGNVQPGEEVEVPLTITAPTAPGDYALQIDLVQEMVSWFADKGGTPQKLKVTVGK